ncbi:hypothetical protein GAQ34_22975 [Bacteroides uniformis]|uniref:Uncharacterized protein n=1 Tax=Bacteroides uniformis TaxID=820 RepID=A0A7J5GPU3_BACUN|nr:hypothetical protein GAQ34_22975 [Bacteroides uniformis]
MRRCIGLDFLIKLKAIVSDVPSCWHNCDMSLSQSCHFDVTSVPMWWHELAFITFLLLLLLLLVVLLLVVLLLLLFHLSLFYPLSPF